LFSVTAEDANSVGNKKGPLLRPFSMRLKISAGY
jgi:hypothetical protein